MPFANPPLNMQKPLIEGFSRRKRAFVCRKCIIFASRMKKAYYIFAYWTLAVLLTACMLSSLQYTWSEALFISTLFLPGSIIVRFVLQRYLHTSPREKILGLVFFFLGVLVLEVLLITIGFWLIHSYQELYCEPKVLQPNILINPLFISLLIVAYCAGDYRLMRYLDHRMPILQDSITFVSDRHNVTLRQEEIRYIESRDKEVWIFATDNRQFRSKCPISQWENMLDTEFVRTHRSFLVNRSMIQLIGKESVSLSEGTEIPVSRKYRDSVAFM